MTDRDFRDAFHCHKQVVYRFAFRMTGSSETAEDIVQDCFVALWKKPGAYDPARGAMRAFLLGMARNMVLKRWRDERPYASAEYESAACFPVDLIGLERAAAVASAIGMLPPLQREALVLAEYEEMSLEEIAAVTQAELAAVKSRLHRARQNLRRMLARLLDTQKIETKGASHGIET